jgi:hypothetical protein
MVTIFLDNSTSILLEFSLKRRGLGIPECSVGVFKIKMNPFYYGIGHC